MLDLILSPADEVAPYQLGAQVQVWLDSCGIPCAYGYRSGTQHWLSFPGLARFGFKIDERQVIGIPEEGADLAAVADTFARSVLPLALQARGLEALHASAIATPLGEVAFCATSGTGKSTLAYALSLRGYPLRADDSVIVQIEGKSARAVPTTFTPRLRAPAAAYFGIPAGEANPPAAGPEEAPLPLPLAAICILERSDSAEAPCTVQVDRLGAGTAFSALLTHAYCFSLEDSKRKQAMVRHYLALAAEVPVYRLCFVPGLEYLSQVQDAVEALLGTA